MHTSRIIQPGGIPIYIAMVVSAGLIHLLPVMAAGGRIGIVIDVLVISAGCWVVSCAVCAAAAGVTVSAVVTGGGGCAVAAGGAVGVGTVGVGSVAAAVGVGSHFADCLVEEI